MHLPLIDIPDGVPSFVDLVSDISSDSIVLFGEVTGVLLAVVWFSGVLDWMLVLCSLGPLHPPSPFAGSLCQGTLLPPFLRVQNLKFA